MATLTQVRETTRFLETDMLWPAGFDSRKPWERFVILILVLARFSRAQDGLSAVAFVG